MRPAIASAVFLAVSTTQLLVAQSAAPNFPQGSGFVPVDGSKIYYQECGNGPAAVVLMHDGVVDSAVWNDVWGKFCSEFHTIRYDRRGYGQSSETIKPYYEADDLAAILHDRKIQKVALVASSHGGNVALNCALRYSAQVSQLVLIGPSVDDFPYSEHFAMEQVALTDSSDPVKARLDSEYLIAPGNNVARDKLRALLEAAPQDHKHKDMPLPEKSVFPYAENLRIPTLILTGAADIADNQAVAGALQMAIPGAAREVIAGTGHLPYLEKPDVFFPIVSGFLEAHGFSN